MCGINVIWSREAQSQAIQQMAQATLHRGPDHTGTIDLQQDTYHLHLSVNRLKILDPHDRSNQPFCPDGKKNILAWNGEIYNYHTTSKMNCSLREACSKQPQIRKFSITS